MKFLAIDTSGAHLTVIAVNGDKISYEFQKDCGVKHSVSLMPAVERAVKESGLNLKEADFIAAAVGAGSFTGIRIGVSTAKALAFAFGVKCLAITSFDTVAYNINGCEEKKLLVARDAGHNGYYVCGYDKLKVVFPPKYLLKEELCELCREYTLCAGEPLAGFAAELADIGKGLLAAAEKKAEEASFDYNLLSPLYVRKSQAEEGR